MRSIFLIIVAIFSLFNCKTFILDDEQIIADIPVDIELIKIPAGAYSSGEDGIEKYIEYDYMMMKYPVTNSQYIEFIKEASENGDITVNSQGVTGFYAGDKNWPAGIYEFVDFDDRDCRVGFNPPNEYVIKWNWFGGRIEGYDNHPITEVTWFGANAFAEYYGMQLPTKQEWEKAARANTGYKFSWGNNFDPTKVNFFNSGDIYDNSTTPVGFYNGENNTTISSSPFGIYDMIGNVWEWTDSWNNQSPGKIIKGGSWKSRYYSLNPQSELHAWYEPSYGYSPNNSISDVGFRCVKILE